MNSLTFLKADTLNSFDRLLLKVIVLLPIPTSIIELNYFDYLNGSNMEPCWYVKFKTYCFPLLVSLLYSLTRVATS